MRRLSGRIFLIFKLECDVYLRICGDKWANQALLKDALMQNFILILNVCMRVIRSVFHPRIHLGQNLLRLDGHHDEGGPH
jgi:hypothetical protein